MNLSSMILPMMIVAACAATRTAPERPWKVEVHTAGGFAGKGVGTYTVDSEGRVSVRRMNGTSCSYQLTQEELTALESVLAATNAEAWKESYLPENTCCDRIEYSLTVEEAGKVTKTAWIDNPEPMPKDLVALTEALVGGEKSIRVQSIDRCR